MKKRNRAKQNDLRILEFTNKLNEKTYSIEQYRIWGKHMSMWFTEKSGIETYENAVKIKSEMEQQILKNTIVQIKVL